MTSQLKACWVSLEGGTVIDSAIFSAAGHLNDGPLNDFPFFPVQISCWCSFLPVSCCVDIWVLFQNKFVYFWVFSEVPDGCCQTVPQKQGVAKPFLNSLKSSVPGMHLICHPPRLEGPGLPGLRIPYASATPWCDPWKDACHLRGGGECLWLRGPGPEEVTFLPSPNLCLSAS